MARQQPGGHSGRRGSRGWAALGWFWAVLLVVLGAGAGALQWLGPPPRPGIHLTGPLTPGTPLATGAPAPSPAPAPASPPPAPSAPAKAGAIPPPIPALLEPSPQGGVGLPRIGPGGRMPAQAYAAAVDAASAGEPRVAVLLAGIGMAEVDSEEAMRGLPRAISLAVSPYAPHPQRLLQVARETGHETLVSIPMEPMGAPLNDAGSQALLTSLSPEQNHERLLWALSRIAGYVGATAAMSGLRGERFAATAQMQDVLNELASRGLLYVDPRPLPDRPGGPALARPGVRVANVLIDEPAVRSEIDAKLARLEQLARDHGSALGVAGLPAPVTVQRLTAWAAALAGRGIALVPVSALVPLPKPAAEAAQKARP